MRDCAAYSGAAKRLRWPLRFRAVLTVRHALAATLCVLLTVPFGGASPAVAEGALPPSAAVTVKCQVVVASVFTLVYTAGKGGSIIGVSPQHVPRGGTGSAVRAFPDHGYTFVRWCDGSTSNPRTDAGVVRNITVEAVFAPDIYTINASAGSGGTIEPAGEVAVAHGGTQTFTVAADEGYQIDEVLVDGEPVAFDEAIYVFEEVVTDHVIHAGFIPAVIGPLAMDDAYETPGDTALVVPAPGVLENDTCANGTTLIAQLLTTASNGTLLLYSNGGFLYSPEPGFAGEDSFTYRAFDGQSYSDPVTVIIRVTPSEIPAHLQHNAAGVVFNRWVTGYSPSYSGGGYVYSRWAGTKLTATFSGTKIRWVGPKQPSYGMADVYIDGALVAQNVDCYAPEPEATLEAVIWESEELAPGEHTIELRLTAAKNPASAGAYVVLDRFEVPGVEAAHGGRRFDERDGVMTGSWLHHVNLTYYSKTYSYSRWTNATFALNFEGTRISWVGPRTTNYGMADVYIDGVKVATVDQYRENLATQGWREVVWESEKLAPGSHTLEIKPLGTKNPAAIDSNIVIDAFDVMP